MLKRAKAGDIELAVHDAGQGKPVVLLHGFPLEHSMWEAQIEALSKSQRVLAFDLRGFGQSDVAPGTATMAQMADDVAAALDALQVAEPAVVCGLSMGGYVAWQFWARHRPRLAALVACDTRAVADTDEAKANRYQLVERILADGADAAWQAMHTKLFGEQTIKQRPELVERSRQAAARNSPEGLAAALRGMAERESMSQRLAEIDVPTLVLVGEHDAISPPAEMEGIAGQIAGAEFVVIPQAGHLAPLENPGAVNQALRAFLAKL